MAEAWRWKPKDGAPGALRYEPGNWGDLLKGAWVQAVVQWLRERFGTEALRYTDGFAGWPAYTLPGESRRRLERLGSAPLVKAVRSFVRQGAWPSAARIALGAAGGNDPARFTVTDADPERRHAWEGQTGVTLAEETDGFALVAGAPQSPASLVLLDPYDAIKDFSETMRALQSGWDRATVLLYVYNRAARSPDMLRQWRDFRNRLADLAAGRPYLVGRVAADAFLPSAHHEMMFLPGRDVCARADFSRLCRVLEARVREIDRILRAEEAFERSNGTESP